MQIVSKFEKINKEISEITKKTTIVVVTKNQSFEKIKQLIDIKHYHFGENKVQDAMKKWRSVKSGNVDIKLHFIGRLQTNKVKDAVGLFDYIHSLDSIRLADVLSFEENKQKKKLKYFIQVNIGNEIQKGGVINSELSSLVHYCKFEAKLDVCGLMCMPPNNTRPDDFFKKTKELNEIYNFNHLSMGMSNDYQSAIEYGATFVRIGSAIFNDD